MKIWSVVFAVISLALVCAPVNAGIQVYQGDTVYLNETIDVTYVVGWEQQLGWWSSGSYENDEPDLIFDTTDSTFGNQRNFYLDPTRFPLGWYYKWDGVYEKGSNPTAFYIAKGERPKTNTTGDETGGGKTPTKVDINQSIINENLPELQKTTTDLFICRGYPYTYRYSVGSNYGEGYLWLFGINDLIPQLKMKQSGGEYVITIPKNITSNIQGGTYKGLLQFSGDNGWQDIFYKKTNKDVLLVSPFKEVENVSIKGIQPKMVLEYIYEMRNAALKADVRLNDDEYIEQNVTISDPSVTITEFVEYNSNAYVMGITTIPAGEEVTIRLDEDRYTTQTAIKKHTWYTNTTGDYGNYRIFAATIPLNMEELSVGNHTLTATPKDYPENKNVFVFKVGMDWTNPTPTQEMYKVVIDQYGVRRITLTPTPTPTPEKIYINNTVIVERTVIVYQTPSGTPTPEPTPNDNTVIPLPTELVVISLVVVSVYTAMKRRV